MILQLWNKSLSNNVGMFMNTIGDGVFIVEPDGTIIKTNEAACTMLGYENKKQVMGQSILLLLGATDEKGNPINKRNAALYKSIRLGKKINATRQFTKNDGTRIWTSITTTPVTKNNEKVTGAIVVIRDITEQKQEEEYRTDFAHIASHDLRAPLGNVLWATEYILSEKPGQLNKKQKEYLGDTYKTLKDMNRLVNDLLGVSRLHNHKIKPRLGKVMLENIIKKVIADTNYYAKAQNLEIKVETDSKCKHYILADSSHIKTIIQNLVENALRYAFTKTEILINIKKEKNHVVCSCSNKGIGIPKNKQKFIFAKFFRAKNAVDKQGDGTGLGLYLTQGLVKLNKGQIWFESELNQQTSFYLKFKKY
ncbi:MAG: PAS domain-containing sensor histidine kinase [bacterium]